MNRPNRIPLFPLDVVLFPGVSIPLHIFEPRYKLMIAACMDDKCEFGMLLASDTALATIGCTAEVVRKIKQHPDGRMDILAEGRAVFHVKQLLDESEYYEGIVEYAADTPSIVESALKRELCDVFDKCHILLFGRQWENEQAAESDNISYRMAALLPIELEKKQAILEVRTESDRCEFLLYWMSALLPELQQRDQTRERAGGNGHSPSSSSIQGSN